MLVSWMNNGASRFIPLPADFHSLQTSSYSVCCLKYVNIGGRPEQFAREVRSGRATDSSADNCNSGEQLVVRLAERFVVTQKKRWNNQHTGTDTKQSEHVDFENLSVLVPVPENRQVKSSHVIIQRL